MALFPSPARVLLVAVLSSSLLHLPASAAPAPSSESGLSSTAVTSRGNGNVDIATELDDLLSDHASEGDSALKKEESDFETQNEDLKIDEEVEMSETTESSVEDITSLSEDDVVDVNKLSDSSGTSNSQANRDAINKAQVSLFLSDDDMKTSTRLLQEDSRRNKKILYDIGRQLFENKDSFITTDSTKSLPQLDVMDNGVFSFTEESGIIPSDDMGGRLVELDPPLGIGPLEETDKDGETNTEGILGGLVGLEGGLVGLDPPQDKTSLENDTAISSEDVVGDAITAIGGGVRALGIGPLEETDKDGETNTEDILTSNIGPTNWQIFALVLSIALLVASGIMVYFIAKISKETDSENVDLVVPLSKIPYMKVETAEVLRFDKVQ